MSAHIKNTVIEDVTKKDICRDYIWGRCIMGSQCKFRHELDFEFMKKTLKFCHDFQNSTGCLREHCTYLHATKEEQTLFIATGQLPKVLAERHAMMSAATAERHAMMSAATAETIPQIALYIQESFASTAAPPPPPPPPLPATTASAPQPRSAPAQPTFTSGYPRPSVGSVAPMVPQSTPLAPRHTSMMPMQQLAAPPPQPTSTITSVRQHAPVFTGPTPGPTFGMVQPPPLIPMYDASKPPPPIMPMRVQPTNGPSKRQSSNEDGNACPSKLRKGDEATADCEQCLQKEQRIKEYKAEYDAAYEEEELANSTLKTKSHFLKNLKEALLIGTFQKYVDENSQKNTTNIFHIFNQAPVTPDVSKVPNQFLLQLMQYVTADARDEDTATSDKSPPPETPDLSVNYGASTSGTNGSYQYPPSKQQAPVTVTTSAFPSPGPSTQATTTAPMYAPHFAPAPPPAYQPYQPIPPTGLYYPQQYGLHTGMEMPSTRTQVPVTMHPPAPVAPPVPQGPQAPHAPPGPQAPYAPPGPQAPYAPPGSQAPYAPPGPQAPYAPPGPQAPYAPPTTHAPHAPPQFYQTSHYGMGQHPPHYQRHQ